MTPKERKADYTDTAQEIYDHCVWKCWKFRKTHKLDSYLKMAWGILFQRPMTDFDISNIKHFIDKRKWANINYHLKGADSRATSTVRNYNWIGADGYLYQRKILPTLPVNDEFMEKKILDNKEKQKQKYYEYEKRALKEMAMNAYFQNEFIPLVKKQWRKQYGTTEKT